MQEISRRSLLVLAGAVTGAGVLAACGGVAGGGGNASGSIRYAFWGNDQRRERYAEGLASLQEDYPDIDLNIEFADYGAFQERMTTQMAAGDVADIFWVPSPQVLTYHANGLYRRLDDLDSLDLSDFSDQDIEDFKLDGEYNTMPHGSSIPVVRYNHTFAEEDGVELPEDWSWDWIAEFAVDYTENNPHGRRALPFGAHFDLPFEGWLRQRGEDLWTEDGRPGFSEDGLASWIEWWKNLLDAGATASISEQDGVQVSWTDVGDDCLLWFGNSNHIVDEAPMYPDYEFRLRNLPIASDAVEGHQYLYFPRMAIYSGLEDDQAELAGHVLTYCSSNVAMQQSVGLSMGVPPNPRVAQEYEEFANDVELEMIRVVNHDREVPNRRPRYEAPPGSGTWRDVMERVLEEVTLGDTSVSEAAASMIEEVTRSIDRAAD
ncbi:ABC transporter substrate-binding protein [Pseudactinotalea sp. Z1732]|uniref:ABC transporter substrate-binding protein n=1 Tax=Micrococcales TaxID=85006 RepID=UPI003C7AA9FC